MTEKIVSLDWGIVDHDVIDSLDTKDYSFDDEEISVCRDFLNTKIKNIKFKEVKQRMLNKKEKLDEILKIDDFEGHNKRVV